MTGQRRPKKTATRRAAVRPAGPLVDFTNEPFTAFFENASDIIIVNDREGRIIAANRAARDFGGYTLADVERGVHLGDILPPAEYEPAMIVTQRALDGLPIPEVYEREAILRDRGRRIMELRSNVLQRNGRPYALQTIGRDVTDKREAAAFQTSLLQVSQALLTAQSLDELGRVICEEASRVLHVDGAYLWLRRGDELVGCAAAGRAAAEFVGLRRPVEDSTIGQIYRAKDVLVVNDFLHSLYAVPDTTQQSKTFGVQAMLAVPLRRQGPGVGVLVFADSTNPRRFTTTMRDRALIFGAQTTVAIESALAREREEEEGRVSAALLYVSRAIREALQEADLLRELARSTREVLQCEASGVLLWDPCRESFRVVASHGVPPEIDEELRVMEFPVETLPELQPLLEGRTIEVPDASVDRVPMSLRWSISSMLTVPLSRSGHLLGALSIGYQNRRGSFSQRERRIAEGIAAQAAVAVENTRLVEDLRRANQLKSEFLGTMSHELRTPLSAILGYAELMRDGAMEPVGPEQAAALDRILVNGRALLELINMTLDVNRLEAGRMSVHPTDFSVSDLFAELRSEFAVRAMDPQVTLSWSDSSGPPPLHTDHGKLKAVLRNLIDNALKFTAHGTVEVRASGGVEGSKIWLVVRDTGVGIPREDQATIFDMFSQLHGTAPRGGVGLGLYLVRRFVDLLGGSVTVESAPGEGSTFTVEVPRQLSAGDAVPRSA